MGPFEATGDASLNKTLVAGGDGDNLVAVLLFSFLSDDISIGAKRTSSGPCVVCLWCEGGDVVSDRNEDGVNVVVVAEADAAVISSSSLSSTSTKWTEDGEASESIMIRVEITKRWGKIKLPLHYSNVE